MFPTRAPRKPRSRLPRARAPCGAELVLSVLPLPSGLRPPPPLSHCPAWVPAGGPGKACSAQVPRGPRGSAEAGGTREGTEGGPPAVLVAGGRPWAPETQGVGVSPREAGLGGGHAPVCLGTSRLSKGPPLRLLSNARWPPRDQCLVRTWPLGEVLVWPLSSPGEGGLCQHWCSLARRETVGSRARPPRRPQDPSGPRTGCCSAPRGQREGSGGPPGNSGTLPGRRGRRGSSKPAVTVTPAGSGSCGSSTALEPEGLGPVSQEERPLWGWPPGRGSCSPICVPFPGSSESSELSEEMSSGLER